MTAPAPALPDRDQPQATAQGATEVEAHLKIDAQGHVTEAEFTLKLDAISQENLGRDAENWLFLPALVQGEPRATEVRLPIGLTKS